MRRCLMDATGSITRSSVALGRICGALEDELVAAEPAAAGDHPRELKPARPVEIEDLLRLRDLEGVTTDPVDEVMPDGHAAHTLLRLPVAEGERILPACQ